MALKTIRIGSAIDIFQYDDGAFPTAIHTEGPIQSDTAPTNPNEVVRLVDVGVISGDVIGSGASTDKAIVRFDGVTGKLIQDSLVTINDTGSISLPVGETVDGIDISVHAANVDAHHAQVHTILSHDTLTTGAELTSLADDSMADALHRHSELSAADGVPNQAVFVDNAGNVGIGTDNPEGKLHVYKGNSGGSVSSNSDAIVIEANTASGLGFLVPSANNINITFGDEANNEIGFIQYQHALDSMNFRAGGTTILTLKDGNVGIETTVPTQLFSVNEKAGITSIGGFVIKITNKTGVNTVAGQLVKSDTATDDGFIITAAGDTECFGVVYESGMADNEEAWIVVDGIADVAMEDNTAATHGNWVETSDAEAGYANATTASPPAAPAHFEEIGHCIESVVAGGAGTHILARCKLHFN